VEAGEVVRPTAAQTDLESNSGNFVEAVAQESSLAQVQVEQAVDQLPFHYQKSVKGHPY
jgi:hypothetical protein